jgi:hypothetical protein
MPAGKDQFIGWQNRTLSSLKAPFFPIPKRSKFLPISLSARACGFDRILLTKERIFSLISLLSHEGASRRKKQGEFQPAGR